MTKSNDPPYVLLILGLLSLGLFTHGCGGSSSETPPPLPPSHRTDRLPPRPIGEPAEQRSGRASESGDSSLLDEAQGESPARDRQQPPDATGQPARTPAESTWGSGE